jgi:hypothetical protein
VDHIQYEEEEEEEGEEIKWKNLKKKKLPGDKGVGVSGPDCNKFTDPPPGWNGIEMEWHGMG